MCVCVCACVCACVCVCVCVCRDKATETHYKEKIAGVERQLLDLHRQEQCLQDGMKSKSERRKLSIF